jgi:hypothetical protein
VSSIARIAVLAEMHGRDLLRRRAALVLLVLLPLSFYFSSGSNGGYAVSAGGIGMSFAVAGASLFSILSSAEVDQRLVLAGYRPLELLLGRLVFLVPLGLVISALFAIVMIPGSNPERPLVLLLGLAAVALVSVPFGLAVGAAVPRELEGTLVLIGIVGMQMAADIDAGMSKVLPFYGPRRLLVASLFDRSGLAGPGLQTLLYGLALLAVGWVFTARSVGVQRHVAAGRRNPLADAEPR